MCKIVNLLIDAYAIILGGLIYTGWIWFIIVVLTLLTAELIIGLVELDIIGVFGVISLGFGQPHMIYKVLQYKGLTQSASLWHWQTLALWVIYAFYRLLNSNMKNKNNNSQTIHVSSKITYSNQPILFVTTILTIIFVVIMNFFDCVAIYKWYILKTRVIIRPDFVLKRYHDRNEILDKQENEEWLMKNGVAV